MRTCLTRLGTLLSILVLVGCATPARPIIFKSSAVTGAGSDVVAGDFLAVSPAPVWWQSIDGDGRALDAKPYSLAPDPARGAGSSLRVIDQSGDSQFVAQTTEGWVLCATESPADNATSRFTPPLLIAPARLAPGKELGGDSEIRVTTTDTKKSREQGNCQQRVHILGGVKVDSPLGSFDATLVESVFTAMLGMTRVRHESLQWVVPGKGAIAERWIERISVLGVLVRTREGAAVRVVAPAKPTAVPAP